MSWTDRWQNVNWRFFAYFLIVPIILFYSITLTGCLPGLQSVYLVNLHVPSANSTSSTEIRIGYFGLCAGNSSNFVCSTTQGMTASSLTSRLRQFSAPLPDTTTSESMIQFAMTLQGKIFPPLLAASGVIFFVGLISFLLLRIDIRKGQQMLRDLGHSGPPKLTPERTERYRKYAILLFWTSTGLVLASTVAVAQTAAAIQFSTAETVQVVSILNGTNINFSDDNVSSLSPAITAVKPTITAGTTNQVLQWLMVSSLSIFAFGISKIYNQPFWKIRNVTVSKGSVVVGGEELRRIVSS
ncbi:hypothetical protein K469DRAFT_785345 [Zopfia rhizophila CBS 207.26]|uniref:Uncharacterized protein n=1 Tax=Zopfia rhizophila CBS 207.26 TaxID=1314779 RepID=A0A6A6DXK8_9PEZI|nr:hypothetical protein K469DRAFT_785345 [Zopfia rhizophila CBS 207.26]